MAWVVDIDPEIWTLDTRLLPDAEREEIRETVESWAESGPPEAITTLVFGRMLHDYQMANGIAIKFCTEEDGAGGGIVHVLKITVRYWFPSD